MTHKIRDAVLASIAMMLRPVLRLCVRHGTKLNELIEIIKTGLIKAAAEELGRLGERISESRLSAMTGVHRRDVHRLRGGHENTMPGQSIVSKVLGQWQQHPKFITQSGVPKVLSVQGAGSEFFELVRSISADLNPYTILYELERMKVIERTPRGLRLKLTVDDARKDLARGLSFLAEDIDDLGCCVDENLLGKAVPPHLHLKSDYDNIVPEALPKIRTWFLEQGDVLHRRARTFLSQFDRDANPRLKRGVSRARVVLGTFSMVQLRQERDE